MNRTRAVALSMLLLAFAMGGLTGMALEEGLGLDWFDFLDEDRAAEVTSTDEKVLLGMQLSEEQRKRIEEIFEAQDEQLEAYWRNHLPALRSIVAETDAQIEQLLNDAQRADYRERTRSRSSAVPAPRPD